jgi:hypothetical protein
MNPHTAPAPVGIKPQTRPWTRNSVSDPAASGEVFDTNKTERKTLLLKYFDFHPFFFGEVVIVSCCSHKVDSENRKKITEKD